MKHRTLEEKAAILAEYDRLPRGSKKQALVGEKLSTGHIQLFRKQLGDHFDNGKKAAVPATEVIEVSAEPDINELIYQAIDHVEDAQRLIDKARFLNGKYGVVAARFKASLVGADEGLTIVKLDLTMASICNEIQ
jgi:hypothetical protein